MVHWVNKGDRVRLNPALEKSLVVIERYPGRDTGEMVFLGPNDHLEYMGEEGKVESADTDLYPFAFLQTIPDDKPYIKSIVYLSSKQINLLMLA